MNFDMIKKNKDFKYIYGKAKSFANKKLIIYYIKNNQNEVKIGISISKKVGKAVVRNHLRRLIKENLRHINKIKKGYSIIIIARVGADELDYHSMRKSIIHLLKKTYIYESEKICQN